MKINYLSKREIKQFSKEIMEKTGIDFQPERVMELEDVLVLINKGFMIYDKRHDAYYPFLADKMAEQLPKLEVDQGAVESIKRGANVMRPGVTGIDSRLKKGVPVLIRHNGEPLAIGISQMDYEEALSARSGVVAKNVHRPNDRTWSAIAEFIRKHGA